MTVHRSSLFLFAACSLAGLCSVGPLTAQEVVQPLPGTTDADRLGDMMRRIGANPQDVDALLSAGELSLKLGDLSGAAALFARAEKVDPRNPRVKAGEGAILVRSERPGEALRYFAQAEAMGLDSRRYAADRGFAYDLIGQQDRAQRDYRVALKAVPDDDETVKRYALSLGISGKQDLALAQLTPLLHKTDRGAWRARAFVLAMGGDVAGAERIATTMMPAGMASGLQPFFQRLPTLPAIDRAFAVHFGEVHATPDRIADARMTPPLPVLGPDASAPIMVTAIVPAAKPARETRSAKRDRSNKAGRNGGTERVQVATAAVVPVVAAIDPTPAPPAYAAATRPIASTPMVQPLPGYRAPVTMASAQPNRTVAPVTALQPGYSVRTMTARGSSAVVPSTSNPVLVAPAMSVVRAAPVPTVQLVSAPATTLPATTLPATRLPAVTLPITTVVQSGAAPVGVTTQPTAVIRPVPTSVAAAVAPTISGVSTIAVAPAAVAPAASVVPPPATIVPAPPKRMAGSEDSILAKIIAGLSIPASELDVAPPRPVAPVAAAAVPYAATAVPDDAARMPDEAKARAERRVSTEKIAADKIVVDRATAAKTLADKKAADRKAVADRKALAEKKAAAAERVIADKEAAEQKRIARANPERIWVQVAGGATEGDLPKAWKAVKGKAAGTFGSRGGWTTPLRATNRVLAGPFKTDAEARTFVNALKKDGVSAFTFTSDVGQVVTKLPK